LKKRGCERNEEERNGTERKGGLDRGWRKGGKPESDYQTKKGGSGERRRTEGNDKWGRGG